MLKPADKQRLKTKGASKEAKTAPHDLLSVDLQYRTKSQSVYDELRQRILLGRLEPRQRLDQEWLAQELQVSRMPLRQALLKLEADGLIENRPHRGALVAPLSSQDLQDIYFTRRALEAMLAEAGAVRINPAVLKFMAGVIEQQKAAVQARDIEQYVKLDRVFHGRLYEASGYGRACEILEKLRDSSDRYIRFYAGDRRAVNRSIREHEAIVNSCRAGKPAQVCRITETHINHGLASLLVLVKRSESEAEDNKS